MKLPEVLVVHLKRFRHDAGSYSSKLNTAVSFPLVDLSLAEFTAPQVNEVFYDLVAVISHYGGSADCKCLMHIGRDCVNQPGITSPIVAIISTANGTNSTTHS